MAIQSDACDIFRGGMDELLWFADNMVTLNINQSPVVWIALLHIASANQDGIIKVAAIGKSEQSFSLPVAQGNRQGDHGTALGLLPMSFDLYIRDNRQTQFFTHTGYPLLYLKTDPAFTIPDKFFNIAGIQRGETGSGIDSGFQIQSESWQRHCLYAAKDDDILMSGYPMG